MYCQNILHQISKRYLRLLLLGICIQIIPYFACGQTDNCNSEEYAFLEVSVESKFDFKVKIFKSDSLRYSDEIRIKWKKDEDIINHTTLKYMKQLNCEGYHLLETLNWEHANSRYIKYIYVRRISD